MVNFEESGYLGFFTCAGVGEASFRGRGMGCCDLLLPVELSNMLLLSNLQRTYKIQQAAGLRSLPCTLLVGSRP